MSVNHGAQQTRVVDGAVPKWPVFRPFAERFPPDIVVDHIDHDEFLRQVDEALRLSRQTQGPIAVPSPPAIVDAVATSQFERLLLLLALTPEERDFVRAALENPLDADLFSVLADYLEERGKESAEKFRRMAASQGTAPVNPEV